MKTDTLKIIFTYMRPLKQVADNIKIAIIKLYVVKISRDVYQKADINEA